MPLHVKGLADRVELAQLPTGSSIAGDTAAGAALLGVYGRMACHAPKGGHMG